MNRESVQSSMIASLGYEAETSILEVEPRLEHELIKWN